MNVKNIYHQLNKLKDEATEIHLDKTDKWVIFSDLHMGDRSSKDDFQRNSELFKSALTYYFKKKYQLFLNGDVEELQKFSYQKIRNKWDEIYLVFQQFRQKTGFLKTIGNHDLELSFNDKITEDIPSNEAYLLKHKKGEILLFHGHQASHFYFRYNKLVGWILKYLANPLGIGNYSVAHNSKKQYDIEKRVYHYSVYQGIVSIIGHTHRPLFESLSKAERLKMQIENLCREYADEEDDSRLKELKKTIKSHKKELKKIFKKKKHIDTQTHLYNALLHIPCLFNSGTVIGKRGITCLEIENNDIKLVHWFDSDLSDKYLKKRGYDPEEIEDTGNYRMVLNQESLDYVFARIKLLS